MRLVSLLHRWAGGLIGLLLALLGLSGAILVWEGSWISLPGAADPLVERPAVIAHIADRAAAEAPLSRITFANDETGVHQLVFADGGGAYVRQDGTIVDRWATQWERPELWLFDFHHHLFAGHTGETVTGVAALFGLMFVVTGLILWWRSRRSFAPRLLPKRLAPGPIVRHHRDLGLILSPLLLLSMGSGVMMLFEPVRETLLGAEERPKVTVRATAPATAGEALLRAKALFPDAELRRLTFPREPGGSISVRMRQPFEWTPNGRTQLSFAPDGTLSIEDASAANRAAAAAEKLYPLHSAKVGGVTMKLLMTASGLGLFLLGSFATWSFWVRRSGRSRRRTTPAFAA